MGTTEGTRALQLTLDVWHPNCWVLETTEQTNVGFLGYGVYSREDGRATQHCTIYSDTRATIEEALVLVRNSDGVHHVSALAEGITRQKLTPPGNASRKLLVEHDGDTQISEAFTQRGFVLAEPADVYNDIERWTLLSQGSRDSIQSHLDAIRDELDANITVQSVVRADRASNSGAEALPLDRLSHRQREVFQLARDQGYYAWPREASAGELAEILGITTSTLHEHLLKIEAKLLNE